MREANIADIENQYQIILQFWTAVRNVFPSEWQNHRHSLLTKGVGLYSLMELLGDLILEIKESALDEDFFMQKIRVLTQTVDWNSKGMFAKAGGRKGAHEVYQVLKKAILL